MTTTKDSGAGTRRTRGDAIRAFNKRVLNPAMMRVAGRRHWYAGVIRHTGRRTGGRYATPVVAERVDGGFVIPLPYGTGVDWLRNVLAAGGATLEVRGESFAVTEPRVVGSDEALPLVRPKRRRVWSLLRIEHYLRVSIRVGA
ncbi:MAG TPA: hypothetical protein VL551_32420 [Actinospica sp.]|jgi:deazaflavin-dependent oxidoreductase (nitroreductase family)|nr:hypothetical protein [Actinospica sp.]